MELFILCCAFVVIDFVADHMFMNKEREDRF